MWSAPFGVFLILLLIMAGGGWWLAGRWPFVAWWVVLVCMAGFVILLGHAFTGGLWRGALITPQNRVSLSRLQMVAWTVLILSTLFTFMLVNVRGAAVDPLAVAVPAELWVLMGISATSLVGSPLLLSPKRERPPRPEHAQKQLDEQNVRLAARGEEPIGRDGVLACHGSPSDSRWSDLFRGEEVRNAAYLDIGRVQMFFFTLVLVLAYAYLVGGMLMERQHAGGGTLAALPELSQGMLALLGISHSAYLAGKALPGSDKTEDIPARGRAESEPAAPGHRKTRPDA
jgi:hypothetical protein